MALDKNKIIAEATKLVQKGAYDKAIKTYERILQEDPKDVRVLLKVGELHQKKGDDRMAADAFKRVAETYADQGFFLKSVAVYKQVVKLDAEDVRVNERLAGLYQQLGLISEAMAQLQVIAAAHEKAGDGARLLEALKRMVELDPENIGSVVRLGKLYQGANQPGPALDHYRRAADYLKKHNRADDYLKVAERIIELAPSDLALTRELAKIYMAKGDTKRALSKLQVSFKADGRDVETLTLLAQAFRDLGQVTKTVQVYKTLAEVHERAGRQGDALNAWRRVVELAPDDPDAGRVLAQPGPASPAPSSAPPRGPPPAPAVTAPAPAPAATPQAVPFARPVPSPAPPFAPTRPATPSPKAPPAAAGPVAGAESIPKLLTETDVYVKYGLAEKAIGHLRTILAIDPETPAALEKLRDLHLAAGRREEALDVAEQAIRAAVAKGEGDRARGSLAWLRHQDPASARLGELASLCGATEEIRLGGAEVEEVLEPGELPATLAELELAERPSAPIDDDALAELAAGPGGDEVVEDGGFEARPPDPEPELEGPDAELLRAAMASIDSDEVVDEQLGDGLPELGEEPPEAPRAGPAAIARAAGPAVAAPGRAAPVDLTDELEEADFFAQQGFFPDAHDALLQLQARHPGHPALEARLADLERRMEARASSSARPAPAPGVPSPEELRGSHRTPTMLDPSASEGASFDLGADLAEVLDQAGPIVAGDDEFQYSVEDVFNQFKRGVAETVTLEDSDTHYDLGIAYREMGLIDDAVNEFETALRGNNRKKEIDSLSMIATCRMAQDRPGDAIEPLRRALRSDYLTKESAKAIYYELGLVHQALDQGDQALWFMQKVARVDPIYRDVGARIASLGGGPGRPPAVAGVAPRPPAAPPGAKKNIGFL